MTTEISKEMKYLMISLAVSIVLIVVGILSRDAGVLGNTIVLATFALATPQFLLRYRKYRELKEMEERFPVFLRDLIESLRSGVSLPKAIQVTGKLEYGKLSKEIKKMSNQVSWGMNLDKILDQFANRVEKSKRLCTGIKIIRESYLSGGDVVSTLESVAENSIILRDIEKDRRSSLSQYVLLMYAISVIFLGVVVVINRLLIPIFNLGPQAGEVMGLSNPCLSSPNIVCSLFQGTASIIFSIDPESIAAYYTSLFFFMSLIQSIFSGLVAGQISENSVTAGIKHSLILSGVVFGSFHVLIKLGLFGI